MQGGRPHSYTSLRASSSAPANAIHGWAGCRFNRSIRSGQSGSSAIRRSTRANPSSAITSLDKAPSDRVRPRLERPRQTTQRLRRERKPERQRPQRGSAHPVQAREHLAGQRHMRLQPGLAALVLAQDLCVLLGIHRRTSFNPSNNSAVCAVSSRPPGVSSGVSRSRQPRNSLATAADVRPSKLRARRTANMPVKARGSLSSSSRWSTKPGDRRLEIPNLAQIRIGRLRPLPGKVPASACTPPHTRFPWRTP